jgi:hypothetical protein
MSRRVIDDVADRACLLGTTPAADERATTCDHGTVLVSKREFVALRAAPPAQVNRELRRVAAHL